ncbi:UDP-N-acetylglucosamine 2-epimerase [Aquimarina sp. 2304DJ70-9]|uniref:UDP-N-acetylglucosamine 2-epimerase n=1 Tax=Aquimarina penaris TaxID=3231044 RepID=UPI003461D484
MRIAILTSSRADYGIYLPLLDTIKEDPFFELEIIAFGTHLSKFHGHTIDNIVKDKYRKIHKISSLLTNDDELAIATSYGLTVLKFSDFWDKNKYDLVMCLGDRFEMSAAVQAGIPFGVKFAHIHGGETTLGAIDNTYRHQITLASSLHFVATEEYKDKITQLTGSNQDIYVTGALSLDEVMNYKPIERETFYKKFDLKQEPYALVTFHPETVSVSKNSDYAAEMKEALEEALKLVNLVITMPNADTQGTMYRERIYELKDKYPERVVLIENFGKINYFSAMWYAELLLGNTSSGIIEAASFKKYVINVGDRQKGRSQSKNVLNVTFDSKDIVHQIRQCLKNGKYLGDNRYYKGGASESIISRIKELNQNT